MLASPHKGITKVHSCKPHLHYPGTAETCHCLKLGEHTQKPPWILPVHPPTQELKAEEPGTIQQLPDTATIRVSLGLRDVMLFGSSVTLLKVS